MKSLKVLSREPRSAPAYLSCVDWLWPPPPSEALWVFQVCEAVKQDFLDGQVKLYADSAVRWRSYETVNYR